MKRITISLVVLALSIFVIFSCKEDSSTEPERSDPTTDYQIIEGDEGTIGAAGGIVTVPSGNGDLSGVFVEIPEGALRSNKNIKITSSESYLKNPEDSSAIFIEFQPYTFEFEKPIKIGLPIKTISSSNNVRAYHYDESLNSVSEMYVESVNLSTKIATVETNHFSVYYATDKQLGITANMTIENLNIAGKAGVRIIDLGGFNQSGLQNVYSRDNGPNALESLYRYGAKYAHVKFCLYKNISGFDEELECDAFTIEKFADDGSEWEIRIKNYYSGKTILTRIIPELDQDINTWFSCLPLVYKFSTPVKTNAEYYFKIIWFLSPSANRDNWYSANTQIYEFSSKKNSSRISSMTSYSNDSDGNFIDDDYQTNNPPEEPYNLYPGNYIDIPTSLTFKWECSDPENDPLTYDFYFGTSTSPPLFESNLETKSYFMNGLDQNKDYSWKVVAKDDHGNTASSETKTFTTLRGNNPPADPSNPSPEDNATGMETTVQLDWECSDPDNDPLTYDIYFGKVGSLSLIHSWTYSYYTVSNLESGTEYSWKIIAKDSEGASAEGDVWSFTTRSAGNNPPTQPSEPDPADGTTNVWVFTDLEWECSDPEGDPLTYDVYFAENTGGTVTLQLIAEGISDNSFYNGELKKATNYFWKIIAYDNQGNSTSGSVWSFTTEGGSGGNNPPNPPTNPNPVNGAEDISTNINLTWTCTDPDGDDLSYYFYFGESMDPPLYSSSIIGNNSYSFNGLHEATTYYWKIEAVDGMGDRTEGPIWSFTTQSSGGDTEPPQVYHITPFAGTNVSGVIGISAQATDNVGVSKVVFERKAGNSYVEIGQDNTGDNVNHLYEVNFDTRDVADGAIETRATAYDNSGNTSSDTWSFNINNTTPTGLPFSDNFELANLNNWVSEGSATISSTDPAAGQYCVKGTGTWSLTKDFGQELNYNTITLEYKMKASQRGKNCNTLFILDGNDNKAAVVFFRHTGFIEAYDGGNYGDQKELLSYEANRWYSMKIVLNMNINKYSVYIDNQLLASGFKFYSENFSFPQKFTWASGETTGTGWLDEVDIR